VSHNTHDLRAGLEIHLDGLRQQRAVQQASIDDLVSQMNSTDVLIDATEKLLAGLSTSDHVVSAQETMPAATSPSLARASAAHQELSKAASQKEARVFTGSTAHKLRIVSFRTLQEAGRPMLRRELMKAVEAAEIPISADEPEEYLGTILSRAKTWFKSTEAGWTLTGTPLPD